MSRLWWLTAPVLGLTLLLVGHASVAAQSAALDGAVHQGTCNSMAAPVSELSPSLLGTGDRLGSRGAIPAASSFSTIPLSLDALLADEHVVTASKPGGDVVACGEVGGFLTDGGALVIGLEPIEGSAVMGIAYLAPSGDPAQTDVSLFVAGERLAEMAIAEAEEVAQEIPQAIVEEGGVDVLLTPLPVAEPEGAAPVAAQQTGLTAEELAYSNDVVRIIESETESFDDLVALTDNPRIGQDDWTMQVVTQFFIWDQNYEEALALAPPPVFAEMHALFVEALRLYSEAGDDFVLGLDTLDSAVINQGVAKMSQANELINQASEEINRIREERGG
jgi:hypothetical protein